MRTEYNYSLAAHNTFGINVRCRCFVEFSGVEEAVRAAALIRENSAAGGNGDCLVIGAGSNLLLTRDVDGIVVTSAVKGISLTEYSDGSAIMRCGSGEVWDDVVAWTVERGFASLVNLSLIPGHVGASAVQNIGAYGAEAGTFIDMVHAIDIASGSRVSIPGSECGYGYRDSRFKKEWSGRYLITHVDYALSRSSLPLLDYGNIRGELERRGVVNPTPWQLRETIIAIRRSKLPEPSVLGNAGSFFKNPVVERARYDELAGRWPSMPHYDAAGGKVKIPAGWLIDQCGWKGRSLGRAAVYERQALVLVNLGGATGSDIVALSRAIQDDVRERFGISIEPEVNIV